MRGPALWIPSSIAVIAGGVTLVTIWWVGALPEGDTSGGQKTPRPVGEQVASSATRLAPEATEEERKKQHAPSESSLADEGSSPAEGESSGQEERLKKIFLFRDEVRGVATGRYDDHYREPDPELIERFIRDDRYNQWDVELTPEQWVELENLLEELGDQLDEERRRLHQIHREWATKKAKRGETFELVQDENGNSKLPPERMPGALYYIRYDQNRRPVGVRIEAGEIPEIVDAQQRFADIRDQAIDRVIQFFRETPG